MAEPSVSTRMSSSSVVGLSAYESAESAAGGSATASRLAEYVLIVSHATPLKPISGQRSREVLQLAFETDVIDRFPPTDHSDFPLPPGVAMFCIPEGVRFVEGSPPLPKFHAFATTIGNGDRLYGYCLEFYEPVVSKAFLEAAQESVKAWMKKMEMKVEESDSESSLLEGPGQFNTDIIIKTRSSSKLVSVTPTTGKLKDPKAIAEHLVIGDDDDDDEVEGTTLSFFTPKGDSRPSPLALSPGAEETVSEYTRRSSFDSIRKLKSVSSGSTASSPGGVVRKEIKKTSRKSDGWTLSLDADVYCPKSLVILSRFMFLNQFREFLMQLYRISLTPNEIPIERYLCNFMNEVPVPPRGKANVVYSIADCKILFSRPAANNPFEFTNFPLQTVFSFLNVEAVVQVIEALALERQVLLLSKQYSLLTMASETFLSLLYPFRWQHVFIPLLPQPLLDFLCAPMPFLIGTITDYVTSSVHIPDHVIIVDLDNGLVKPGRAVLPKLPAKERKKLLTQLKPVEDWHNSPRTSTKDFSNLDLAFSYAMTPDEVSSERSGASFPITEKELRYAFFRVFVSIFRHYKEFLIKPTASEPLGQQSLFNIEKFLASQPPSSHSFLNIFLPSQMFEAFCQDRLGLPRIQSDFLNDVEDIVFFDEAIIAKLNRSMMSKFKATPFLDDIKASIRETYIVPSPDKTDLPKKLFQYKVFPNFDPKLFSKPRAIRKFKSDTRRRSDMTLEKKKPTTEVVELEDRDAVEAVFNVWFNMFCAITGSLRKIRYLNYAFLVLKKMKKHGFQANIDIFRRLIELCGVCKAPDRALRILDQMTMHGLSADAAMYSALLKVFSENGDLNRATQPYLMKEKSAEEKEKDKSPTSDFVKDTVAEKYGGFINLKNSLIRFEELFPGLKMDLSETCPSCEYKLSDLDIRTGWSSNSHDFTTSCPACRTRFVAKFVIKVPDEKDNIICEYLSPVVINRELHTLLKQTDGKYIASADFQRNSPTLFWNLIWQFTNLELPIGFALLWLKSDPEDSKKSVSAMKRRITYAPENLLTPDSSRFVASKTWSAEELKQSIEDAK